MGSIEQQFTATTMPSMMLLKQQAICPEESQIFVLLIAYLLFVV
jgi:hypothetical protein